MGVIEAVAEEACVVDVGTADDPARAGGGGGRVVEGAVGLVGFTRPCGGRAGGVLTGEHPGLGDRDLFWVGGVTDDGEDGEAGAGSVEGGGGGFGVAVGVDPVGVGTAVVGLEVSDGGSAGRA